MQVVAPAGVVAENAGVRAGASSVLNFVGGGAAFNPATGALDLTLAGGVTWPLAFGGDELFQPNDANAQNMLGLHVEAGFSAAGGLLSNGSTIPYAGLYVTGMATFESDIDGTIMSQQVVLDTGGNGMYVWSVGGSFTINTDGGDLLASTVGGNMHLDTNGGQMLLTTVGEPMTFDTNHGVLSIVLDGGSLRIFGNAAGPLRGNNRLAYSAALNCVVTLGAGLGEAAARLSGGTWTIGPPCLVAGDTGGGGIAWSDTAAVFVAVGQSLAGGVSVATSTDGITWTPQGDPTATPDGFSSVIWADTLDLFVAWTGNGDLWTSPDGETWTDRGNPFGAGGISVVAWSSTLGLLVAVRGTQVATSTDGITWTLGPNPLPFATGFLLTWGDAAGVFVLAGVDARLTQLTTSADGITWTPLTTPLPHLLEASTLIWSSDLSEFCLGGNGEGTVTDVSFTSSDGITWSAHGNPFPDGNHGEVAALVAVPAALGYAVGFGNPYLSTTQWLRGIPPQARGVVAPELMTVTDSAIVLRTALQFSDGFAAWGHAVPAAQPVTPVTLGDVIALIQSYGLCA